MNMGCKVFVICWGEVHSKICGESIRAVDKKDRVQLVATLSLLGGTWHRYAKEDCGVEEHSGLSGYGSRFW
jgi:hypothetical protein